jgi:hypothetical protein
MTDQGLSRKLKLKQGQRAALISAPEGYRETLGALPAGVELAESLDGQFDWIQIFVKNQAELAQLMPQVAAALKQDGKLWISFPKGSSKIQTDLTRDQGWDAVAQADLKWINLISINPTWSAFSLRPYKPGEARQTFR